MVSILEESVRQLLADYHIHATTKREAPGVYVENKKICSVGLRIRRGCSYHGLALNVAMDLTPFSRINPCGFQGLAMTHMAEFQPVIENKIVEKNLLKYLLANLS